MDYESSEDWEETDWEESEWEEDDDDEVELLPCPSCGAEIYEDAEYCSICGEYIVFSTNTLDSWPPWAVALGFLGIIAVILTLLL